MAHYCYMVRCRDGSLYTGYSTDPERRLAEHNAGEGIGAKYTRSRRPCELVHVEEFATKQEAMAREYEIKHRLSKAEKEELVRSSSAEVHSASEQVRSSSAE